MMQSSTNKDLLSVAVKNLQVRLVPVVNAEAISEVAQMARTIWPAHFTSLIGEAQVEYMLDRFQSEPAISSQIAVEYYRYFLIVRDATALGYAAIVRAPDTSELLLSKFYLLPEYRGHGFGRAAWTEIEAMARNESLSSIRLTVNRRNASSIAVYKKLGLKIEQELVQDIGNGFVMDDYLMRTRLDVSQGLP